MEKIKYIKLPDYFTVIFDTMNKEAINEIWYDKLGIKFKYALQVGDKYKIIKEFTDTGSSSTTINNLEIYISEDVNLRLNESMSYVKDHMKEVVGDIEKAMTKQKSTKK